MSATKEWAVPTVIGTWDDALLAPIAEINEQTLELLKSMAQLQGATPRLVQLLREEWLRLDERALRRLAACPYLLLDAQLAHLTRWQRSVPGSVMDAGPRGSGYFQTRAGVALIRRTLLLVWHLARSNQLMAGVTLGLSAAVAERIATRRLADLDAIAEVAPTWILPRWEQQPLVWQQLMTAARSQHPLSLKHAQLRGLQLLARAHTRP